MTTAEPTPSLTETHVSSSAGISPFLHIPPTIPTDSPAPSIIHLKRDAHQAIVVNPGSTLQTRFGEFPHSSFANIPYGSQVRASAPHANQIGRDRKRKRNANASSTPSEADEITPAPSGFVHILAPTAELWTASLPHRTQVVYTPDSSYILHRLGVKPGSQIIEAGAGSGSFTHASVRAVYAGYPDGRDLAGDEATKKAERKCGKVWSFEFHAERAGKLQEEIRNHGLDGLVQVTHKDVCAEGFMVPKSALVDGNTGESAPEVDDLVSPGATSIFLDLPAPWLALPHLTRNAPSPLSQNTEVTLCSFSPCIEQVTRTCSTLRSLGWVDISTVEIAHANIEVRRQLAKGYDDGAGPRTIAEALARLKGVNEFRDKRKDIQSAISAGEAASFQGLGFKKASSSSRVQLGPEDGKIITRQEPEIKSHTSFLTFACLPRAWTEEQEKEAAEWVKEKESTGVVKGVVGEKEKKWKGGGEGESKRAKKKAAREAQKAAAAAEGESTEAAGESKEEAAPETENMEVDG